MRILGVNILKAIDFGDGSFVFPASSKIVLDNKGKASNKVHQLIYQQGPYFGQVGDCCRYLTNSDLLDLESKGFIKIKKAKLKSK